MIPSWRYTFGNYEKKGRKLMSEAWIRISMDMV